MGGRNVDNIWCSIKFYQKIDLNWLLCNESVGTHTLGCDIYLQLSLIIELSLLFKGLQHIAQRTCMWIKHAVGLYVRTCDLARMFMFVVSALHAYLGS